MRVMHESQRLRVSGLLEKKTSLMRDERGSCRFHHGISCYCRGATVGSGIRQHKKRIRGEWHAMAEY